MSASLSVSAVLCAYTLERWGELYAAVESVQGQSLPTMEIIVVIDHNQELLSVARRELTGVTVLENRERSGLSGARNSGVAEATGEVVAFLDDDAIADPNWLMRLTEGYQDPRVLGTGGAIIPMWAEAPPPWFPEEFHWVVGCTYRGLPRSLSRVRNFIGCNMSFRKEVLAAMGGFRHEVGRVGVRPMGCEETEICIRIARRWPEGMLVYEPAAQVYHRIPASRANWRYFRERCYSEGLSKAQVGRLTGSKSWLSTELAYSAWTLPLGIVRGLAGGICAFRPAGLTKAGAIMAGLVITAAGYLRGTFVTRSAAPQELAATRPDSGETRT